MRESILILKKISEIEKLLSKKWDIEITDIPKLILNEEELTISWTKKEQKRRTKKL